MKYEVPEIEVVTLVSEVITDDNDLPGVSGEID